MLSESQIPEKTSDPSNEKQLYATSRFVMRNGTGTYNNFVNDTVEERKWKTRRGDCISDSSVSGFSLNVRTTTSR